MLKPVLPYICGMKKMHIVLLVLIAVSIAALISFMGSTTSYETIASAKKSQKTVSVVAKVDVASIEYDISKNPNYFTFTAVDTATQEKMPVVYYFEKPVDIEKSVRIVLKGRWDGQAFQIKDQKGILLKCPSKYKDDMEQAGKQLQGQIINQ
jgi:hypothetical protein